MRGTNVVLHGNGLAPGRFLSGVLLAMLCLQAPVRAGDGDGKDSAVPVSQVALDAAFEDAYERYQLPGLAVGIVVDGDIVYSRVKGELVAGSGQAIDRDTLFKIASNSKAMTTALLARLVDQGKLRWDDPVVKYLPDFRMYEDWVTREMQVRDLLIHNSGLGAGAGDLMHWPEPNLFTREDVIRGLRHLKPLYSFRSRYAYDNTLYIVAGEVAAAAGGAPYDVLVRRELFGPLGMDRCQVGEWDRDAVGNVAQPHMHDDGRNVVIRADDATIPDVPMMAAGGIRCSLDDMLGWVRMWLQPQRFGTDAQGRPWLSQSQREELWKTHTPMPLSRRMRDWDGSHFSGYGYGWRLTDVDGTWKVSHTGTLAGMYSAVVLLPEKSTGFVFMTNGNADDARTVLTQVLVKHFTAMDASVHTVAHYAGLLEKERVQPVSQDDGQAMPQPASVPVRAADIGALAGRYRDPWFGDVEICPDGDGVRFTAMKSPKLTGELFRAGQRMMVQWEAVDVDTDAWLDFQARAGAPVALTMAKTDPEADFSSDFEDLSFVRVGDCGAD